ncbi:MAG: hypothetical protein E3J86_13715 [Candidatus Thorarchaeota archaeon]|nr:MAG: hypothetical protein E3J86_13715 [Candidatus Thorarchaeota archaeon]
MVVSLLLIFPLSQPLLKFNAKEAITTISTPHESSPQFIKSYSVHEPIIITSDSDFETQGWPGAGTEGTPYVLENLNISAPVIGIQIANTTKHFVIRNCWFSTGGTYWGEGSITLTNVISARIEDNHFAKGYFAICVFDSSGSSITGNTISTSVLGLLANNLNSTIFANNVQISDEIRYPVRIQGSNKVVLRNNTFSSKSNEVVRLTLSIDCVIEDNDLRNLGDVFDSILEIRGGSNNLVTNNTLYGGWQSIRVRSNDVTISDNVITPFFSGIDLQSSNRSIIESNTITGFEGTGIGIESRGRGEDSLIRGNEIHNFETGIQLQGVIRNVVSDNYVYDCVTGLGLEEAPRLEDAEGAPVECVIANNTFVDGGLVFALYYPSDFEHEIQGNTINGGLLGYFFNLSSQTIDGRNYGQIILVSCTDVLIENGELREISLIFSDGCEVRNVSISQSMRGIYILQSTNCLLSNIESMNNGIGVFIEQSDSCFVYRSRIHGNHYGIYIHNSLSSIVYGSEIYQNKNGLFLIGAHSSTIESNSIHTNSLGGIFLFRTNDTLVGNNDIIHNVDYGIYINGQSSGNSIVFNRFGWNYVNAMCLGIENIWNYEYGLGNSWSDYSNTTTYVIDEDDEDRFPSLLGDGPGISQPIEQTNSTVNDLLSLTPLQYAIASVMIGCVLVMVIANLIWRKILK